MCCARISYTMISTLRRASCTRQLPAVLSRPFCYGISETSLFSPSPEYSQFRSLLRAFVRSEVEPQAQEFNATERMNLPLLKKLGQLGVHGICVPETFGGSGMSATGTVIAMEELSYSDPGLCLSTLAHSVLFVHNLFHNGSEEQRNEFVPKAVAGDIIGGMCMSEPHVGTDVLGMRMAAVHDHPTNKYILNGEKMWITNGCLDDQGTLGDVFLVYAKDFSKTSNSSSKGSSVQSAVSSAPLSLFIVPKESPGLSLGQKLTSKCGMRSSNTAELVFTDCRVDEKYLVGSPGSGLIPMMRNLEIERIALAAMSLGIAKRCIDVMAKYSKDRTAFGKPIASFGQIQKHVADSYAEYTAARCYVYSLANSINLDKPGNRIDSDAVKLVASSMAKNVADRSIQVLGGYGYLGEFVVERLWRDAKLLEIGGGTLEAHQKNITYDLLKYLK